MENGRKRLSETSEMQKTPKNVFPTPRESQKMQKNARRRLTKREKREKVLVVGRRNAEIARKRSLSVDETRKTLKNARRRSTKRKKR